MGHADSLGILFHDHGLSHGAGTPSANWHDVGGANLHPGGDRDDELNGHFDAFWIDLGGEG